MKSIKLLLILLFFIGFVSCTQITKKNKQQETEAKENITYLTNDTIATFRKSINAKPVAIFREPVADEFNKWEFGVKIYETKETFKYTVKMRYKELSASDVLNIPNFGIVPKVILKKGIAEHSCIIGFEDKKGNFKEYKMAIAKQNQLKIIEIKSYFVGVYATKKKV